MPTWESHLEGCWRTEDGEATATIDVKKRQVKFLRDGAVGSLYFKGEDSVWLELGKYTYAAKFETGMLKWDNGEMWRLREAAPPAPAVSSPTAAGGKSPGAGRPDVVARFFTGILPGDPGQYRVLQGVVFKKPGADPTTDKGIKKVQAVGSIIQSTGRLFRGKNESEWVELECPESPGWVLVQGQGVGMPGPLLQKVEPHEEVPFILRTTSPKAILEDPDTEGRCPKEGKEKKFVMRPSASMTEVKAWISLLFKLDATKLRIMKPEDQRPSTGNYVVWHNRGEDEFVPDSWSVKKAGFRDGDLMEYTCFGFEDSTEED